MSNTIGIRKIYSASLVVQCGQTGCRRAQDDVSLGSYGRGDDFHQESLAPPRSAVYVHQQWHRFNDLLSPRRSASVRPVSALAVRIQILLAAASVPSQAFSCHFSRVIGRFWQAEVRHGASHRLQSGPIPFLVLGSGIWTYLASLVTTPFLPETWEERRGHEATISLESRMFYVRSQGMA